MHHVQGALPVKAVVQGHYQVEAVLSKGETGNTYLVRDKRLGQQRFILKEIIHLGGKVRYRFPIEPTLLQQLEHPALPHVYHAFTDVQLARSYLLVEFIAGKSALHLLSKQPQQRLGLAETMELMLPIMDAAAYLHRQLPPVIHRDIKPSNIIVSDRGFFLVDFGLAKQYEVDATTSMLRFGSPGYCAPEQYSYQGTSSRVDIYALGATFYKCLTGTIPIESVERIMQLYELKSDPLVPLDEIMPGLPSSVVTAVHRALEIDSDMRFATVEQFREALEQDSSQWLQPPPGELMELQQEEQLYAPGLKPVEEKEPEKVLFAVNSTPVLAGKESRPSTEVGQHIQPRSRKKQYLRSGSLVALAAALLLSVGMGLWWVQAPASHSTSASMSAMNHSQMTRSRSTVHASLSVMKSYQGTMYNIVRNTRTTMSLLDVQRQQHTLRGVFHGPLWNALFVGMIDTSGQIQFVATDTHGQETFSFNGVMRGDGTLAGSYCEPMQNGKCRSYGLWSVIPEK